MFVAVQVNTGVITSSFFFIPAKIYANEGAAQFLFLQGTENCKLSYADRKGKYMYQKDVTLPKL